VAVRVADLPPELHDTAGTLGREPAEVERFLEILLATLEHALALPSASLLDAWRARDALVGGQISWSAGHGTAAGIDGEGRLVVELAQGGRTTLDAGEVHLQRD
jgi:biotin-(acetyl-CoA carboxylase) ligase